MSKNHLKIYTIVSLIHVVIVLLWTYFFRNCYVNAIFYCVSIVVFSHLFFWFGGYAPRIGFKIAEEGGKLKESMERTQLGIFLTIVLFGIGALVSIVSPLIKGEIERIIFFFVPGSLAFGAFVCLKHIRKTLKQL